MTGIKPWAVGPFEMFYHVETHFLKGEGRSKFDFPKALKGIQDRKSFTGKDGVLTLNYRKNPPRP